MIIFGWLKSPEGGIRWGKSVASFCMILIGFKVLSLILGGITRKAVAMNKKCSSLLGDFFVNTVHKAVFVIGVVVAFQRGDQFCHVNSFRDLV